MISVTVTSISAFSFCNYARFKARNNQCYKELSFGNNKVKLYNTF